MSDSAIDRNKSDKKVVLPIFIGATKSDKKVPK